MDDEADGVGDEGALRRHTRFLRELVQALQGRQRVVGVNGGATAGMPGVPGLEKIKGFAAPNLSDDDSVGIEAHCRFDESRQVDVAGSA